MIITLLDGSDKEIRLKKMSALQGWEIQRRFTEFAMSKDPAFRTEFTMEVLSFAEAIRGKDDYMALTTGALIDNHLQTWQNIEKVFNGVLLDNGINPETHAEKEHYWTQAGAELATAFIGQSIELIGPLMGVKTAE